MANLLGNGLVGTGVKSLYRDQLCNKTILKPGL